MATQQHGPALMKVTTAEGVDGGETITKKPAAIPQQLELTRSLASVSNIYSHYVADLWLAFAIDAKHTVKSLPLRENNRTWRSAFMPSRLDESDLLSGFSKFEGSRPKRSDTNNRVNGWSKGLW
jgi:hypothetical protein